MSLVVGSNFFHIFHAGRCFQNQLLVCSRTSFRFVFLIFYENHEFRIRSFSDVARSGVSDTLNKITAERSDVTNRYKYRVTNINLCFLLIGRTDLIIIFCKRCYCKFTVLWCHFVGTFFCNMKIAQWPNNRSPAQNKTNLHKNQAVVNLFWSKLKLLGHHQVIILSTSIQ